MDIHYENEFDNNFFPDLFLDYTNCDANERDKIIALLKPSPANQKLELPWDKKEAEYNEHPKQNQVEELPKIWPHAYPIDQNLIKYEAPPNPSPVLVSVPSGLSTIQYGQPMMAPMYHNDWQNLYINNMPADPNGHPYIQQIAYPSNLYQANNENMEMPMMRENGRRGRGRANKNYGRNMQNTNEIQASYMGEHAQYPMHYTSYATYYEPNVAPQQLSARPTLFYPPQSMYSTMAPQPHHRVDSYQAYQAPPTNPKYNRPNVNTSKALHVMADPITNTMNGDSIKITSHNKPYEKRTQNVNMQAKPSSIHPTVDVTSTVIVNNSKIEPPVIHNEENSTAMNNNYNGKNFDFKIEHYVTTSKEEFQGVRTSEKNEIPYNVNIKSSIEVKQNGNDNKDNAQQDEAAASNVSAPVAAPATNKPEVTITETEVVPKKEVKEEQPTPQAAATPVVVEKVIEVVNNEAPPQNIPAPAPAPENKSWASLLKRPNLSEAHEVTSKPTAFIVPNVIANTASADKNEQPHNEKIPPPHSAGPKIHQSKSSLEDAHRGDAPTKQKKQTEIPQRYCDDPITYRMGEFLLGYQMDKQTVSLLPRGLTNRSNYCYINSILQALLACPPFYNLLKAMPHSRNPSKHSPSPLIDNMIKFVNEFSPLADGARQPRKDRAHKRNEDAVVEVQSGVPFEPSYIYGILKNTSSPGVFSVEGRQEDAEEFLSCVLNGISDEMLELMKLANNNEQKVIECSEDVDFNQDEEWEVKGRGKKTSITRSTDFGRTPLSEIFRGQLRSRVSRAADVSTDYVQPFFTLQLDIEKAESVRSALEILVGKDQLEGMTCSKTKQQIEAWKQVHLEELPVILILHLKWFDYNSDGCSKICKRVEFPIDLKIDNKLMSGNAKLKLSQKQRQYKLFAVTYHDGKEATKGHYVTDAFHVGYGGWVRYDDSSLKGVSEANVLNPQPPRVPYLLYYRRCDTIGNNPTSNNNVKSR